MPTLRTRAGKGSELSHNELDANFKRTVTQKTTTYQVLLSDNRSVIEGSHASTPFTITLPPVATADNSETSDFEVTINNINVAVVSVDGSGSETIGGSTNTVDLGQWASVTFRLDSAQTGWVIGGEGRAYPPVVANHIRAGNTQLWEGELLPAASDLINTLNIPENTWESFGPTSSGADNIWDELDDLPTEATILLLNVKITANSSQAGDFTLGYYACSGDIVSPTIAENGPSQITLFLEAAGASEFGAISGFVMVPLNSNHVFQVAWTEFATTGASSSIYQYYRGFMTD